MTTTTTRTGVCRSCGALVTGTPLSLPRAVVGIDGRKVLTDTDHLACASALGWVRLDAAVV